MINELHGLAIILKDKGISYKGWHRKYKLIPKVTGRAPCIRIWIAPSGAICNYESVNAELAKSLRKYGNNQGTFPAFNIVPLYRITDESLISDLEKLKKGKEKLDLEKIRSWCKEDNWQGRIINKINRCLTDIPRNLLKIIKASEQNQDDIISELIHLILNFSKEPSVSFRKSLESCVFSKLKNHEDIDISLSLLFHIGDAQKKPEEDLGTSLSVILDVQNWKRYGYPVASIHTTAWLNDKLLAEVPPNLDFNGGKDAFGTMFVNPNEPMPGVKLSGFEVILRSMFNGQPCQYRYEKIDDDSYPIAAENRSLIKKSLEWIADSEREGITWRKVDKNEIVFVYPSKLPKVPPKFASIFGSNSTNNSAHMESRFEKIAEEFIKTFNGIPTKEKPGSIRIFTIRKIDKARSKIIFSYNTTPEELVLAAESWARGCHNIPIAEFGECIIPFPLQIARIVNNIWKRNGEVAQGKNSVERMKYYQGMELLLDILKKSTIKNFLHILLNNSSGLLNHVGNWVHRCTECNDKKNEKNLLGQKQESALILSVFGLLLYKCNERKESYMESMAYLVGQLLHISDELHALYCKVVRNDDFPPQLAGSALFVTAGETPNLAISQLSVRMTPYIAWSKQYRYKNIEEKGIESWRAGWYLNLFEMTANGLAQIISEVIRFNDFEKAQLFIGYLASFPKRETTIETTKTNENDTIGG
ncbi:MAG: hypothetical protein VB085_07810 [Peptococcaceae bacterium]|nr:hypothetical protein [Peptococcaceae bacterium]